MGNYTDDEIDMDLDEFLKAQLQDMDGPFYEQGD